LAGERKVREHDPVNPAAGVLIGSDQPERQRAVDKGKIQHSVDAAIEAAALRIGRINFSTHVNVVQIRLIGDQLDGSTHGSGPVERALRPSQNLNSVQIIKIGVDDDMPILRSRRRGHRDIIQVEAYRGDRGTGGGEAADRIFGLPRAGGREGNAGNLPGGVRSIGNALCLELRTRDRGHADWRILQPLVALLGGHHNLCQLIARAESSIRAAVGCV